LKSQGCTINIILLTSLLVKYFLNQMNLKQLFLIGFFVAISALSYAAPFPPPPPPGNGPACWPPPCIPIDGGITLLMAAGAAYGAKKFLESRKKGESAE
jgi:hypothetical protein